MKRKILVIHHSGSIGGAGLSMLHIVKTLNEMPEYECEVYCPSNPPDIYNLMMVNHVKAFKTKIAPKILNHYSGSQPFSLYSIKSLFDILLKKSWKEIYKHIEITRPDIIVLNSMTLSWLGELIQNLGIKVVCFHRETYSEGIFGFRTKYIKNCLKNNFNAVVFISNFDMQETGNLLGHSYVITDKVNLNDYKLLTHNQSNREYFNVLYMGGISELKGAHVIIKALSLLKNKNIRLSFLKFNSIQSVKKLDDYKKFIKKSKFLLGMDYEANLLKLIDQNGLWEYIDFIPSVTNPERYILESDIVVFPSTKPHQARPIYEAGAARKPIIITNFKQTDEFAVSDYNCLTFNNQNYRELANKILILKEDKNLCLTLGENNYKMTVENHDFSNLGKELNQVFCNL